MIPLHNRLSLVGLVGSALFSRRYLGCIATTHYLAVFSGEATRISCTRSVVGIALARIMPYLALIKAEIARARQVYTMACSSCDLSFDRRTSLLSGLEG